MVTELYTKRLVQGRPKALSMKYVSSPAMLILYMRGYQS